MHPETRTGKNVNLKGVPVEDDARQQPINTAKMPFISNITAVGAGCAFGKSDSPSVA